MNVYTPDLLNLRATTQYDEIGYVVGAALDPARCTFQPLGFGAEAFTPRVDRLTFSRVGIMTANRLATDDDRAYAWQTLMAYRGSASIDDAVTHASECLCDRVTARLNAR